VILCAERVEESQRDGKTGGRCRRAALA
jgi:hypothetical protein